MSRMTWEKLQRLKRGESADEPQKHSLYQGGELADTIAKNAPIANPEQKKKYDLLRKAMRNVP